jgi:DNA anti-recombination protein RmuC
VAGAGLDEGVGNLQRFIAGIQKTSAELGEATSSLEAASSEFSRLQGDADEAIGGLTEDLEDGRDRIDQAFEEARDAVDEVTETAEDIGSSRFGDAEESLDESGQECEGQLAEGRAELEATFARLTEAGFQGYGSAVEEAEAALETLDGADKDAFDGLEEGLGQMRERLDDKRSETGEALDESASEVGDVGSELEDAFTAVTDEWKDAIDNELREGCDAAGEELARIYEEWRSAAESAADALKEELSNLTAEVAEFVQPESVQALAEAVEKGLNDPVSEVFERFDDTLETLGAGETVAESLEGMTPDLQKSLNIVEEVDRLLNAME